MPTAYADGAVGVALTPLGRTLAGTVRAPYKPTVLSRPTAAVGVVSVTPTAILRRRPG